MSKVRTVAGRGGEFMQLSQSSYCVQVYPIDLPHWGLLDGDGHTDLGKFTRIVH
jgi:hypothetical protein